MIETTEQAQPLYYTVTQIAERWQTDPEKVTRTFASIPGVLDLGSKPDVRKRKRGYRILRIPAAVLARVERQLAIA